MGKRSELEDLSRLAEMLFETRSAAVQRIAAKEKRLRDRFETLQAQRKESLHASVETLSQKLTGMDVLHQVWLGRQLTAINSELAQVLVQKEAHLRDLRTAFGKKEVAAQLLQREKGIKRPDARDW